MSKKERIKRMFLIYTGDRSRLVASIPWTDEADPVIIEVESRRNNESVFISPAIEVSH